ncbi:Gfo/Idh/MocA family protein [Arenibaculum pallidiluteum]|uniref:Gfo/Idh/MocA family protein n=1 Tax=Arenibaculum pallidiluteum TaxID=2812559 RepID=UPI001A9578DD|nr:Gfo/Idh/MocA family oxidoreductase [Arenibaculum pallidiluteum]
MSASQGARKVGIVGVGKIALDQHIPSIEETQLFALGALVSQRGIGRPGVPTFRSLGEMLAACPDVEAVAICTPPDIRHGLAREALAAGRHVLLEKPPAATTTELRDLVAAARDTRRTLFATWHSQHNAAVEAARARLAGRQVRSIQVTWKEDVRRWHPGQEWIWQAGGFGVFDPGINALSILTRILPFPLFVERAELLFPAGRDTPIAASLSFRAPAEAGLREAGAEFDWRQEGEQTWTIAVETAEGTLLQLSRGGACLAVDGRVVAEEAEAEYRHIYRRFHALIEAGESDVDAAPLHLVADAFLVGRRCETAPFVW